MNRKQKTSYNEDSLDKIKLDTRNKKGVFSYSLVLSENKAKSEIGIEIYLKVLYQKEIPIMLGLS